MIELYFLKSYYFKTLRIFYIISFFILFNEIFKNEEDIFFLSEIEN